MPQVLAIRYCNHRRSDNIYFSGVALFQDRSEAGRVLAEHVKLLKNREYGLVLALPRGGVPVGFELAASLGLPLDVFVVRKLGLPGEEELALGAVASGGLKVLNRDLIQYLRVPEKLLDEVAARETRILEIRESLYRENQPALPLSGRVIILTDDGLATGASMLAAVRAVRAQKAKKILVAVPVAARETCDELRAEVDEIICAATPHRFGSVGIWYKDFPQVSDEEVRTLLDRARGGSGNAGDAGEKPAVLSASNS